MCVIDIAQKAAAKADPFPGQSVSVPWLICMDSSKDDQPKCNSQVGLSSAQITSCLQTDAPSLLKQYLTEDSSIGSTPTVKINGNKVAAEYSAIKTAICNADSSLAGCSSEDIVV